MGRSSPRVGAALVGALLGPATAGVARADAISGPPACPPGAMGRSAHAGEWCVPWTCAPGVDCAGGATCKPWRVCTRASDVVPGGLRPEPAPPERMELVVGTCDPADNCRGDEEPPPMMVGQVVAGPPTCSVGLHCVAEALPTLPLRSKSVTPPPLAETNNEAPTKATEGPPVTPAPGCGCTVDAGAWGSLAWLAVIGLVWRRRR